MYGNKKIITEDKSQSDQDYRNSGCQDSHAAEKSWYEGILVIKNGYTKIRRYFSFSTRSVENVELYSFNIEEIFNNKDTSSLEKLCKEIWNLRQKENQAFPHLTFA